MRDGRRGGGMNSCRVEKRRDQRRGKEGKEKEKRENERLETWEEEGLMVK